MLSNEIMVEPNNHRCGFQLYNEWRFVTDHYFVSKEDAELFVQEMKASIERVWPDGS